MKVIKEGLIPVKLWLDDIEEGALKQAINLSKLPFAFRHIAIMPDSHLGFGMPIGGVLATRGVVIPNAVGVDIGCGMCAVKTSLTEIDTDLLKNIMDNIKHVVPVGFKHQKFPQNWTGYDNVPNIEIIKQELENSRKQLGTLGGGNHFIEIQKGDDGFIWIMIHSGSRNFGLKIANVFHKKAVELCDKWFSTLPDKDLAFLPFDDNAGIEYIQAMNFALDFAKENRLLMIKNIKNCFNSVLREIKYDATINIHHNYAVMENHFKSNVMIHRKGATSAKLGEKGIIPGSQGTCSYIVEGLGNKESFMSCSHGAGRKMGRKQAIRELNLQEEIEKLNFQGIIHGIRNENDLDEAPGAYKDIDKVMKNQNDLVKILVKLQPLAVIKG